MQKQLTWIAHVKAYQKLHGCTYKEAMTRSKASYQTGGSAKSSYIRRLLAEQKFDLNKIKNPSNYLRNKFTNRVIPSSLTKRIKKKKSAGRIIEEEDTDVPMYDEAPVYEPEPEPEPYVEPIIHIEYDDYHVPELREFKKAQKKKLTKKEREQMRLEEEAEERAKEEARIKQEQIRKKKEIIAGYETLKKQIVAYNSSQSKLEDEYRKELKAISSSKTIRKVKKDSLTQELINRVNQKEKELKTQYMPVFTFMKSQKIKVLDDAHKKLRQLIDSVKK